MKCPRCGAEIVEGDIQLPPPLGVKRGRMIIQEIGKPLCDECLKRLM
jgi:hypothetical protein